MAENLNCYVAGSKCYGENGKVISGYDYNGDPIYTTLSNAEIQANCTKYGRLYNWSTAMSICPSGWHLPSAVEWDDLSRYADGTSLASTDPNYHYNSETAGRYLKATSGWNDNKGKPGNGTDELGFSALPGGLGSLGNGTDDGYFNIGNTGNWWSSSESSSGNYAFNRSIFHYDEEAGYGLREKKLLFSVRCLQD